MTAHSSLFRLSLILVLSIAFSILSIFLPWAGLSALLGLCLLVVCFWKPINLAILIIVIASGLIPYDRLPRLPLFGGNVYISDLVIFLAFFIAISKMIVDRRLIYKIVKSKILWPITVFVLFAFISLIRSVFFCPLDQINYIFRDFRPFFFLLVTFLVLYISIQTEKDLKTIIKVMLLVSLLLAVTQIVEAKFGIDLAAGDIRTATLEGGIQFYGITRAYIPGISFLLFSIYFLTLRIFYKGNNIFVLALIVLMILAVLFSLGRMKSVSLLIGLLILVLFIPERKRINYIIICCILAFSMGMAFFVTNDPAFEAVKTRATSIFYKKTYVGYSLRWRERENFDALNKIKQNPLFGIGLGMDYKRTTADRDAFPGAFSYIHNGYLFLILKMGYIVVIPLLWLMVLFFKNIWHSIVALKDKADIMHIAVNASLVTYISLLISSLTQPEFAQPASMVLIALIFYFSEVKNIRSLKGA